MPTGGKGRQTGLQAALRDAVASGQLPRGTRLPSTRALAAELGWARATVVGAYEQLVAEGILVADPGAGTRVSTAPDPSVPIGESAAPTRRYRADFRPGEPDRASFPRVAWLTSVRHAVNGATDDLFGYGDPRGVRELRVALASYLGRFASSARPSRPDRHLQRIRRSSFDPRRDTSRARTDDHRRRGSRAPLPSRLLHPRRSRGRASARRRRRAAGRPATRRCRRRRVGHPRPPIPARSRRWRPRVGSPSSSGRETGGWIIEDDYDGEFRFDRQPVGALQGLDPSRVIYGGTASKSLAAGLHLAWLVLPPSLVEPVTETIRWRVGVSSIEQAALADFITRGQLDRHLRQMRLIYRRRRDSVLSALFTHAPWMTMTGASAGLHGTILLEGTAEREYEILRLAERASVGMHPLTAHRHAPGQPGLVVGYSRPAAHEFSSAVARLGQLVSALPGPAA